MLGEAVLLRTTGNTTSTQHPAQEEPPMSDDDTLAGDTTTSGQTVHDHGIADVILNLDEALSGNIRRAERTARFSIEPWLYAEHDSLEDELRDLVDSNGKPFEKPGDTPANGVRDHTVVMADLAALEQRIAKTFRTVTVHALPGSTWEAFKTKHATDVDAGNLSEAMKRELVVGCAFKPVITAEQYDLLLDRYGESAMSLIAQKAWAACDHTGVDVPKSLVSLAVRRALTL